MSSVLAHGALGPADEFVLLVPACALLVLAASWIRGVNARRAASPPPEPRQVTGRPGNFRRPSGDY